MDGGSGGAPHRLDPTLRTLIFCCMIDISMVNDNIYGLIVALSIFKRHWGLNMVKYYPEGRTGELDLDKIVQLTRDGPK